MLGKFSNAVKRTFDLAVLVLLAVVWLPVFLVVACVVRLQMGSPVIFVQERGGWHGKKFRLLKFRSMTQERDAAGNLLPDKERMTAFSNFLRATSLDELPGLINVLKGDMSLVGPRPFLADYLPLYTPQQFRRHEVRPGITGWAQINGRNTLTWESKFEYDVWYVDHWTFWLDLKILWLTVLKVFHGHGVSQQGHVTAERFRGSAQ